MTETVISSATRTVVIGFDRPFCIIGERINPTGRKKLAAEMAAGDFSTVERDTLAQVEAGAHMLDVNAGIPLADEPAILAKTIQLVQSLTDLPLSIDSSIVAALEAGLAVYQGRPLVNSVTGEEERLEAVLPLIKKYDCAVVAISNDETGISEDPDVRFEVAKRIVHRAQDYGIKPKDIVVDPLVMPIGALGNAGSVGLPPAAPAASEELKVNTTCGASNVSFGLPNRHGLNAAFLSMASLAGMTSAIMNPLHLEEMQGVMGADVMLGKDEHCRRWLTRFREAPAEGSAAGGAARRPRRAPPPARGRCRMTDALVVFTPSGKRGRFALGTPVLTAARQLGVDIDSVCGGRAICGRCQVTLGEGSFAKHGITSTAEHLSAFSATEERYQGRKGLAAGRRLSCQAQLVGDLVVDVPADSQVHRQVVRKRAEVRAIELDTATRLHYVEVEEPDMHRQRGDFERVAGGAAERSGAWAGSRSISVRCGSCRRRCAQGGWKVTVAVHKGGGSPPAGPASTTGCSGVAVDIGSTTIAAHLCDMATGEVLASSGMMNPQIRFGEDLMSRVSYAMMNPGGEAEMTAAVRTRSTRCWASCAPRPRSTRRRAGAGVRRQPDHAPPAAGHRSGRAGRRTVRAGDRQCDRAARGRARAQSRQRRRAGVHPALHRRPCRRGLRRRRPVRNALAQGRDYTSGRRRHQC